jgi:hypothetical protein
MSIISKKAPGFFGCRDCDYVSIYIGVEDREADIEKHWKEVHDKNPNLLASLMVDHLAAGDLGEARSLARELLDLIETEPMETSVRLTRSQVTKLCSGLLSV